MKKWIIILILMTLTIPQIANATECLISEDNSSYIDITSDIYGGSVNDLQGIANIQNLQPSTLYYVKCRNSTSENFTYLEFTTNDEWSEEQMLSIVIGYIVFIVFFMFIGVYINPHPFQNLKDDDDKKEKDDSGIDRLGLRFFFFGLSAIEIIFLVWIEYANYVGGSIETILLVNFWIILIIAFVAAFIVLFKLAQIIWKPDHFDDMEEDDKW